MFSSFPYFVVNRQCTNIFTWKSIGKLGMATERKETIPWSILDDDGNLKGGKDFCA